MAKLMILTPPETAKIHHLEDVTVLGRDPGADVLIKDDFASRLHARIEKTEDGAVLTDLNSSNGTFVDGRQVERAVLTDGCRVTIGDWTARFLAKEPLVEVDEDENTGLDTVKQTLPADAAAFLNKSLAPGTPEQIDTLRERLCLLNELRKSLSSAESVSGLLDEAAAEISSAYPQAQRCAIVLKDVESEQWVTRSVEVAEGLEPHQIHISRTVAERALAEQNAILSMDAQTDPRFTEASSILTQDMRSCMCAPMVTKNGPTGVVHVDTSRTESSFKEDDLLFLVAIVGEASLALESLMLYQDLVAAKEHLKQENIDLKERMRERFALGRIVGSSRAMREVLSVAEKAGGAPNTSVLITGETGAGKELVAQSIHYSSARAEEPFVAINCAHLRGDLTGAELFGIEEKVATGVSKRVGRIEEANRGTLFLDEIGDMPLETQADLLRVLEEKRLRRIGGKQEIRVDVRIIAATNKDLRSEMKDGAFREDLFYRLSVLTIHAPPLRERKEDILPLANHFLEQLCPEMNKTISGFTPQAAEALASYSWPGNVRELRNVVESMLINGPPTGVLGVEALPGHMQSIMSGDTSTADQSAQSLDAMIEDFKKQKILEVLRQTGFNKTRTAEILGMSRSGLKKMVKRFGIGGEE